MNRTAKAHLRAGIALVAVGVTAAVSLLAQPAGAAKPVKVNWYTVTADRSLVVDAATPATGSTVTFTVTNCGTSVATPTTCDGTSGTVIPSLALVLPAGWQATTTTANATVTGNVITVTGLKVPAGGYTTVTAQVAPSLTGAGVAQSVHVCISDITTCTWQPAVTNPTLELPLHLAVTGEPQDFQDNQSLCTVSYQLTDYPADPANVHNVALSGVGVGLAAAPSTLDPSLSFVTATSPPTTDLSGAVAFTGDYCIKAVDGGPYQLVAVAQSPAPSIPSDLTSAFSVYKILTACTAGCAGTVTGNSGTQLNATSNATSGQLGEATFDVNNTHFPTFTCTAGGAKVNDRPDVLQVTSSGDKTATITWSKQVTLKFTDAGTPHWQVCMEAPVAFITDAGSPLTFVNGYYVGLVPLCSAIDISLTPNPCMTLSRNAAQEIAVITIPVSWSGGDPYVH